MNWKWEGQVTSTPVRSTRIFSESLERLRFSFTANAKRQAAACRKTKKIILF